ncbi:hypothetical protein V8E51_005690 [Hyaloscypha variabilis]
MLPNTRLMARAMQAPSMRVFATTRSLASFSTSKPIPSSFQAPRMLPKTRLVARAFQAPSLHLTTRSFASISSSKPAPMCVQPPKLLPDARLMARAFHRVSPKATTTLLTAAVTRRLSNSSIWRKWEGRQHEENTTREKDKHNVQHDASKEGKQERAEGDGSRGTSEQSGNANKKAKEEFPEAPDTIGMQDERGR